MTNGDREGRIVLSNPRTNDRFFFSLTNKYLILYLKKHEKDFQKILNTLTCNMVPYFLHYNDVTDRMRPACGGRAAVRFVCFLSFPRAGMGLWVKQRKSRSGVRELIL